MFFIAIYGPLILYFFLVLIPAFTFVLVAMYRGWRSSTFWAVAFASAGTAWILVSMINLEKAGGEYGLAENILNHAGSPYTVAVVGAVYAVGIASLRAPNALKGLTVGAMFASIAWLLRW